MIVASCLVNLYNCMKIKVKEIQVDLFISSISSKYGKKVKGLKYSKYLFAWHGRFQIPTINSRISFFFSIGRV